MASIKQKWTRVIMIGLLTALGIYSCKVHAQTPSTFKYIGFEGGFGMRSFNVSSNISQINNMVASQAGGNIGVVFGNSLLKYRINGGYYPSSDKATQTQDLYEAAGKANYYPLASILPKSKLQLYLSSGVSLDKLKFYGDYVPNASSTKEREPYLGSRNQISLLGGLGIEYRVPSFCDMIHIFAEVQWGTPVQMNSSNTVLSGTKLNQFSQFSFGISFGRKLYESF